MQNKNKTRKKQQQVITKIIRQRTQPIFLGRTNNLSNTYHNGGLQENFRGIFVFLLTPILLPIAKQPDGCIILMEQLLCLQADLREMPLPNTELI